MLNIYNVIFFYTFMLHIIPHINIHSKEKEKYSVCLQNSL